MSELHVMRIAGKYNSITDVLGISVGHYTDIPKLTGVTVVRADAGSIGGVDVRGSAPGTRETDLLNPINLIERVNAVALCGGSAFGLIAASGVARWLEEHGIGHPVGDGRVVPIVPAAVIFDLDRGVEKGRIGENAGYEACNAAKSGVFEQGNVGAGTGAVSGGLKGGLGTASERLSNGITIGAIAVVNSTGYAFDSSNGAFYARFLEVGDEYGGLCDCSPSPPIYQSLKGDAGGHTTIGVVATDAVLTKIQATKIAQMAQDGLSRTIYPAHTMFDGDTIFCLATGHVPLPVQKTRYGSSTAKALSLLGASAADVFSRAIIRAILAAKSVGHFKCYRDTYPLSFKASR